MATEKKSKGGRPSKAKTLVGKKIGRLTVLRFSHIHCRNSFLWCACDCDAKTELAVSFVYLSNSKNPNCGCDPWKSKTPKVSAEHKAKVQAVWREKSKDSLRERRREWRIKNWPELVKKKMQWKRDNPEKVKEIAKRFRERHREKVKAKKDAWRKANLEKINAKCRHRMATDLHYRLACLLRGRVSQAIRRSYGKKARRTMELIGCTIEFLQAHIERQFVRGMTWEKFFSGEIHLDHETPCAAFDLTREDEQRRCFHWSNLRPMFGPENIAKSDFLPTGERARLSRKHAIPSRRAMLTA